MARDREHLGYKQSIIEDNEFFIPGTQEHTRKEKINNWFHYHKWHLAAGAAGIVLLASIVCTTLGIGRVDPDYQFAYVGGSLLSTEFKESLENALATLGEDVNGDGVVKVSVVQYIQSAESAQSDPQQEYISNMQIIADVSAKQSVFFLVEDPQTFHLRYPILADSDGKFPEEGDTDWQSRFYSWRDCPALTSLELADETPWANITISGQELMSATYIGIRSFDGSGNVPQLPAYQALWQKLIDTQSP